MRDDLVLVAELRPTEPLLTAAQRASLRVELFGAATSQGDDRRPDPASVRVPGPSAREDNPRGARNAQGPMLGPEREARIPVHVGGIRAWPPRAATLAASLLILAGIVAVWTATSSNPTNDFVVGGPATGATTTPEPVRFKYAMSGTAATDVATLTSVDGTGVCYTVALASSDVSECVDADTITAGYAWSVYGTDGDPAVLVGVVPDEVDTVLVNGLPADRNGNIWSITLPDASVIEVRLGDSSTDRWVSTELRSASPSPISTTTTHSIKETVGP